MQAFGVYLAAALLEIAGCYATWMWWRLGRTILWLLPGSAGLLAFAWLLAQIDTAFAGRAYAAYGGVYIAASLGWLWLVEGTSPDRFDLAGTLLCLIGAAIILSGPRPL